MSYLLTLNDQLRLTQSLKKSVRAATIGVNLNLALSFANLDSASLSVGDRILVKDQSLPEQNGIYDVIAGNFLQRSDDAITGKVSEGMLVAVGAGITNAGSIWMVTTDNPITVGVTALTFTQAGGGGGGAVTSVFSRTGIVTAATSDYDANQIDFTPIGTLPIVVDVQAALAYLSHSNYAKTVFVAKNHERATDTRTGLSLYDVEHPYATIQKAFDDLVTAAATDVCVFVADGIYNEVVTMKSTCILVGQGVNTVITRIICSSSGFFYISNLNIKNDYTTSVAPETTCITLSGGANLTLRNTLVESIKNTNTGNESAIEIGLNTLLIYNSEIRHTASSIIGLINGSAIKAIDNFIKIEVYDSKISAISVCNNNNQKVAAIYTTKTSGSADTIKLKDCDIFVETGNVLNGRCSLIQVDNIPGSGQVYVELYNNVVFLQSGAGNTIIYSLVGDLLDIYANNNVFTINSGDDPYLSEDTDANTNILVLNQNYKGYTFPIPGRFAGSLATDFKHTGYVGPTPFPDLTTSIYAKTVFVSKGHERATDTRTGLDLFDKEHPFETINAACTEITTAVETNVAIFVDAGDYDESVEISDQCTLIGRGDRTIITQIEVNANFSCTIKDVTLLSTPTRGQPNEAALITNNLSYTELINVNLSLSKDAETDASGAVNIVGGTLFANNCGFSFTASHATPSGTFYAAIYRATASDNEIFLRNCTLNASTDCQDQEIAAITIKDTALVGGNISLQNCTLEVYQNDGASTSVVSAICNDDTDGVASVRLNNCSIVINTSSGTVDAPIFVARSTSGCSFFVSDTNISVSGPSPNNIYISEDDFATTELRFVGITHVGIPNILPRFNTPTATTFIYEGILSTGIRFPQLKILNLAGKNQVDGLTSILFTEEWTSIDPLIYGEGTTFRFCATIAMSDTALTGTVYLQNITVIGTELVTGSTLTATGAGSDVPTTYRSGFLVVGSGAGELRDVETMYEVRMTNDGVDGADITKFSKAWLEIGV